MAENNYETRMLVVTNDDWEMKTGPVCHTKRAAEETLGKLDRDPDVVMTQVVDVSGGRKSAVSTHVDIGGVERLWEALEDVLVDEDEKITRKWGCFEKGTHREEIWHWFEETFGISVGDDLV